VALVRAPRRLSSAYWLRIERIRRQLIRSAEAQWALAGFNSPPIDESVALTLAAQRLAVRQTDAYLTVAAASALDAAPEVTGLDPERIIGRASRRGVSLEEVFARTALVGRQDGFQRGVSYLRQQLVTNVTLAARQAEHVGMAVDERITGYIRVNNPGGGKVCGMCVAAATRIYHKADLRPMHHHCRCTVATVYETASKGTVDRSRLDAVYRDSGGDTSRRALGRLRYSEDDLPASVEADAIRALQVRVEMDRELGPMLQAARHDTAFTI
jgi:hypothetical protein